jgi:NAD(P)H-dependent FMN reductase
VSRPILQVILASTRPGRIGKPVADWFVLRAEKLGLFDVELVDLAEVNLPFFDEPKHPRLGDYQHEHTQAWSRTIQRGDAFVFVTPEYNHGFNAVLKNAIDYLNAEWAFKPAGIVSYGGVAAGTRAAQMLKPVLSVLKVHVLVEAVNIPFVAQFVDDGQIKANGVMDDAADAMTKELQRVMQHMAAMRA